jgi:outer membrane protein OmpA-like peptidoglycan-associated protein
MARFPLSGLPVVRGGSGSGGVAAALAAALSLATAGCSSWSGSAPPPAPVWYPPEPPMVAPKATPPSKDFNLQVAQPLTNPTPPDLVAPPVPALPPPPVTMDQLTAPDPATLDALPDIPAPAPAPQRSRPIPPPPGQPGDTVSAIEALPSNATDATAAAAPTPVPAPGAHQQTASLPAPIPRTATTAAADATYHLEFAPKSTDLPDATAGTLQRLAAVMTKDPVLRLKFSAYASGSTDDPVAARRLSLQRALKLRQALVALGISSLRVDILALGLNTTESPADRIDITPANPTTSAN